MGYKVYVFAFLLCAGILGSIPAEMAVERDLVDQQGEFHLEVDNGFRLEGMISSHGRSPLKKCFSSLYVESLRPFFLLGGSFNGYLESNFQPPAIQTFFASILIHAP
jgi:hypothetical protein